MVGLAGGVGVDALPKREANGLDRREPTGVPVGGILGRGRGGSGGFEPADAGGRGGSGNDGWCEVRAYDGYVGAAAILGESGKGGGGDAGDPCIEDWAEGCTIGNGRGGRDKRADVRVDGSSIALNALDEVSTEERMVMTSLLQRQHCIRDWSKVTTQTNQAAYVLSHSPSQSGKCHDRSVRAGGPIPKCNVILHELSRYWFACGMCLQRQE